MQVRRDAKWPTARELCGRQCPELVRNTHVTLKFAQDWAERMERALKPGKRSFARVAEATQRHAKGYKAQTFPSYRLAVELLGRYWEHGIELVYWYNNLVEESLAPRDTLRLVGELHDISGAVGHLKITSL